MAVEILERDLGVTIPELKRSATIRTNSDWDGLGAPRPGPDR